MARRKRLAVDALVDEWAPAGWDDPFADPEQVVMPAPTGEIEADCAAEVAALRSSIGSRSRAERGRQAAATDGDFYAVAVFRSAAEVAEFMSLLGLPPDVRFVRGDQLAKLVGRHKER